MNDVNLVAITGVLSDDAKRIAGNVRDFVVLRVQVRREWQGRDSAMFVKVKVFSDDAVRQAVGLRKGTALLVTGRLASEKVEDQKTGAKRYDTYVSAQGIEVMTAGEIPPPVEVVPQNMRQQQIDPRQNWTSGRSQYPQGQGEPYYDETGFY